MRTVSWFVVIAMALIGLAPMGCNDDGEEDAGFVREFESMLELAAGKGMMEVCVADELFVLIVPDYIWEPISADSRRTICRGAHAVALNRGLSGQVLVVTPPRGYVSLRDAAKHGGVPEHSYILAWVLDDGRRAFFDGKLRLTLSELNAITPEEMRALTDSQ